MVMFLAAMPWLGMTVLLGCALASLRPLRFSFRYASALVGLIPIAIYFISASWEPSDSGSRLIPHQALLYAPWVLAVLGSCIICALALAIARLIDYRPGGIPPVLAMLFAIPVFLFHTQVGRDELEYQLLEQEIGPGSRVLFEMRDLGAEAAREATRRWSQSKSRAYDEIRQAELESAVRRVQDQTEIDRDRAVGRCDSFIRNFPKSRYVPNVLFLKGRVQDQRLQRQRLEQDHRAEFRCAVANRASRTTWETLAEKFPDSVLSATALYKLAGLNVRAGQEGIDVALEVLGELRGRFDLAQANTQVLESSGQVRASVFRRAPAPAGLGLEATVLVRQGRRLEEMLVACREDEQKPYSELFGPRSGGPEVLIHPMQLLLWLDDTDPRYQANLEGIARHFADSQTEGYVEIRLALMERAVSRRIQRFQNVARSLVGQPAGAEALFYLGDALEEDSILDGAKAAFEELTEQYPESCWAEEAQERLSSVAMLQAPME
jgi:outer membrane protein assembly factor BamD (BamD/ComL family)